MEYILRLYTYQGKIIGMEIYYSKVKTYHVLRKYRGYLLGGGFKIPGQYSKTRIETLICQIKGSFIGGLV
jgi:hypothetical protein